MTVNSPHITVVIPTYNRAVFLRDSIESVLAQTYDDFELIVVDDGSMDDTRDIVAAFSDDRIKYLYQENLGVSSARNSGVNAARGSKVAFLDSDDIWLSHKLERQIEFIKENPEAVICQVGETWERNGKRVNPMRKHKKYSGWIFEKCLPLCIVSPSAVMIDREALIDVGGFDESLPACEDYDLWLRMSLRYPIFTMDENLIIKRGGHDDQLSRQWGLDIYRITALQKILKDPLLKDEHRPLVDAEISVRASIVAEGAKKRGNHKVYEEYSGLATSCR